MKKYALTVWYRYTVADEMEQDFDYHEIEAESELDAEIIAVSKYENKSVIPFKVEFICL